MCFHLLLSSLYSTPARFVIEKLTKFILPSVLHCIVCVWDEWPAGVAGLRSNMSIDKYPSGCPSSNG